MEEEHGPVLLRDLHDRELNGYPSCFRDMRGQGSIQADIFTGEKAERSLVQGLCLWFRGGSSAWLGTAAELLAELRPRAGSEIECWQENAQVLCAQLERNAEVLHSCGLEVLIKQQDNGPRLISIRAVGATPCVSHEDEADFPSAGSAAVELSNGKEIATEEQALAESADFPFDRKPSNDQVSNHEQQKESSTVLSDASKRHDIRKSLSGFDTANTVPSEIRHRIVITCIVILSVFSVLFLFAWIWPASFPSTLFARSAERQSKSAVSGSPGDAQQTTSAQAQEKTNQQSDSPTVSHGELATLGTEERGTGGAVPEGIPQLLDRSRSGDADAQYMLGRAYETGSGVEQDFVNAYAWYVIADASGNPSGKDAAKQLTPRLDPAEIASVRSKVGSIYATGAYVPRDYTKAYVWFSLAAAAGDPQGEREKMVLAKKMTEQELVAANNRASDWLRKHEKQVR